ncbi:MAG: BON domain-containing protein [bacterium]|nr:BON domain-containing protein [bacterium]
MTISSFFGLLLLMAGALALGQTPASAPVSSPASATLPPDAQLEQAIRARFAKSKISKNKFDIRVFNGVAILGGRADIVQHKGVATRLARLAGANRVDNRIVISERARSRASRKSRSSPRRVQVRWPGRSESERR